MTTARQVRKLVRPLLERHADLTLVTGHMLWLTPVTHVTREIWIDRTSSALDFNPQWTLNPLFLPNVRAAAHAGFCWDFIRRPFEPSEAARGWCWDDPSMPEDLFASIEKTLRFFRTLDTLQACRSFTEAHMDYTWGKDFFENLVFDIALGNLNLARCWWQKVEASPTFQYPHQEEPWRTWRLRIRSLREPLMDDDRAALATLLHRWERENVAGTKAEAIWQPSPFPLETMD
ncbi:hypothetical protein [Methylorubrum thiocyanatum]|uniref:Uncharacterized protein n=1 Tax=Methylorubrum thiocyanatum TaxID=47958 RepID=A0AA40S0U1_9HYPH|nr:hypothetical protein [Methylorubrum thiocyanatum]MBA8912515.1 hypothetical protein [Methylorubrum thiocyanatum]GJE81778.1 hypothetical protein CJNNKLLH_3132 [Methylorubrum thiocyanatum]